jgi:hypothetical protein
MFWFDEVFTTLFTRLPDWGGMWRALARADDATPFGYYAIARISDRLFGPGEIGIRLPSAIACTVGLIVTFFCARRLVDGFHGLISIAFLLCSFLPYYASEGRAYGIYFLVSAVILWCWFQRSALAFGGAIFCGILIHYYVIFCIVPFAVAEALEWRSGKRPSRLLMAGALGAFLSLVIQFQQILANRREFGTSFWASPTLHALRNIYEDMFPNLLFPVALILICFAIFATDKQKEPAMSDGERVGWLFLLIPLAGFVCAALVTNAFTARYFIGALPGVAVAFASLMYRVWHDRAEATALVCIILLGFGGHDSLAKTLHPELTSIGYPLFEVRDALQCEDQIVIDGKRSIVMPDLLLLPVRYYSKHPDRYVTIVQKAPRATDHTSVRYSARPYLTIDQVIEHAHEIAFVNPQPETLSMLRMAKVNLSIQQIRSVTLVYAE